MLSDTKIHPAKECAQQFESYAKFHSVSSAHTSFLSDKWTILQHKNEVKTTTNELNTVMYHQSENCIKPARFMYVHVYYICIFRVRVTYIKYM